MISKGKSNQSDSTTQLQC